MIYYFKGLEEQLLNITISVQCPDLEEKRTQLTRDLFENKKILEELENSFLREFSSFSGNIVDNMDLIAILEDKKTNAIQV